MLALFGRTLRRYSLLLLLTSVVGAMQGAESKVSFQAPITVSSPDPIDAPGSPSPGASPVPGRFIVRGSEPATLRRAGATITRRLRALDAIEVTGISASALRTLGVTIEHVFAGILAATPADACTSPGCSITQWQHAATMATTGWATPATRRIQVAVLDTRIDATHPDWIAPGGTGPDVADGGQLLTSRARSYVTNHTGSAAYHGTFVAGLLGAAANGADAIGVAPSAVAIAPYAVVNGGGSTDSTTLATALIDAWRDGARILNLSLGILGDSELVHDAIRRITRGDATTPAALVVAAAGNNTGSAAFYPGSYPEVLSVAGTAADDSAAGCSNFNGNVGVSAPADRLIGLAPMPTRMMQATCGTSAATPQVSGLAALLFAQDPTRTPAQVRALITSTADDLGAPGRDDRFGAGRINVARALAPTGARVARPTAIVAARDARIPLTVTATAGMGMVREVRAMTPSGTVSLLAADGRADAVSERFTGTVAMTGAPAGVHRILVSARDDAGWGAPVAALITIDATAPVISSLEAPASVRAASPMTISYSGVDALADRVISGIQLRSAVTGQTTSITGAWRPNGAHSVTFTVPASMPPGQITVTVAVADPSGNVSRAEAGSVIV